MPHFEVHRLSHRHWRIDAIFSDRPSAIEEAKRLLLNRRGLEGVRVLQVEERERCFVEWTVYIDARPAAAARRRLPAIAAPALPRPTTPPRQPGRAPLGGASALTLAGLLLACGMMILFAHRPQQPDAVWVFDRPEAWQPHALRNPWTGEVSKPRGEWGE